MKKVFLQNEIWILTFGGSFQRANIYKEKGAKKVSEKVRLVFRNKLRAYIEDLVAKNYHKEVPGERHIQHIQGLVAHSRTLRIEDQAIPINFGVAQKLLNLYLKYQWCLGNIPTPPHFPVDRMIQIELNKQAKELKISRREVDPWTQFKNETKYLEIIDFAMRIRDTKYKTLSLAQLELDLFDRRNKL